MTFEDYQQGGRALYLALVDAVQNILRHALAQHEMVAHGVSGRAKEIASLRKKLADRQIGSDQPMDDIKDLAGCRVVFLTNSQVDAFGNTGALHENFEVVSVNVHHPVPNTDTEMKLFDSTNYLVSLKPERLALTEYRRFEGLHVEIQIQTLLNHAWAEMGHDTIYKEPKLTHLGKARMAAIGERMNKVMQEHLVPAGHDFDKIASDFRQLLKADGAAEVTIATIEHFAGNNELHDALEIYADLVLPHFDSPEEEFSARFEALISAAERSRDLPVVSVQWEYGELPGKSGLDVLRRVADLIRSNRYYEPDRTVQALLRLYRGASDDEDRRLWVEVAEKLAEHNSQVWKHHGCAAQQVILDELDRADTDVILEVRPLLVAMLAKVLSADISGATWRSDSVMIHQGAVPPTEALKALRRRSIAWLEQWLDSAGSDTERLVALQALGKADAMPMQGGDELMPMLLDDGLVVARLILARAPGWSLELRRGREVDALHTHYRFHALRSDLATNPDLVSAQTALVACLLELRDQLASDPDYVLYKTLIGHDTVRPEAWDGDHFDYQATDVWRQTCYPAIIEAITPEAVPEWKARIDRYINAIRGDGGHYQPMRSFLRQLAAVKPDVGRLMAEDVSEQCGYFLSDILAGLEDAGQGEAVLALLDRWLAAGQFLPAIGNFLHQTASPDQGRLANYLTRAIEGNDLFSVCRASAIAAKWYQEAVDPFLIDSVLLPSARFATERRQPRWIANLFGLRQVRILRDLSAEQASVLLASFVDIPDVDFGAVRVLVEVASQHPQLIIDFFGTRLRRPRGDGRERFDAVPHASHDLAQALSQHAHLLLPAVRQWYQEQPEWHEYRGGRLLRHVFPALSDALSAQLIELARQGDEADLKFIVSNLAPYEGREELYPVAMEVVDRLEPGNSLLGKVSHVLGITGVVSGEFGFVEAHAERKGFVERYCNDARPRVQAYAKERARELAQHMAWEQRKAENDVARRLRHWNEA